MSVRFRIINTATATNLATYDVPDAALPILQAMWAPGPGTAAENALKFMVRALYDETRQRKRSTDSADELLALQTAEATAESDFDVAFPPVVT